MIECLSLDELHTELGRGRLPLEGSLELTWRCNLRCSHCYLDHDAISAEVTTSDWFALAEQMAAQGTLRILLTGGEPLLRSDFKDIYLRFKRLGFAVIVFTNGTLLTDEIGDLFAEYPPAQIEITMYGVSPKTYGQTTGVPEACEKAKSGARLLRKRNLPLNLKATLTTSTIKELESITRFAEEIGAGFRATPDLFNSLNRNGKPLPHRLSPAQRTAYLVSQPDFNNTILQAKNKSAKYSPESLFNCRAGITCFTVDPRLNLQLCLLFRNWEFDLRGGSFAEGWKKLFEQVRGRKRQTPDACAPCEHRHLCGICPALNYLETGDPEKPSQYLCENAKTLARELVAARA